MPARVHDPLRELGPANRERIYKGSALADAGVLEFRSCRLGFDALRRCQRNPAASGFAHVGRNAVPAVALSARQPGLCPAWLASAPPLPCSHVRRATRLSAICWPTRSAKYGA